MISEVLLRKSNFYVQPHHDKGQATFQ